MVASSINCQLESCLDTVDNFESLEIYKADFYSYRIKEILWIVDHPQTLNCLFETLLVMQKPCGDYPTRTAVQLWRRTYKYNSLQQIKACQMPTTIGAR